MDLIQIYQCFCDATRLRILHLLAEGPLCVCHFQEILDEPQVKISKHLGYLRARGMVETHREGNFIIYALPDKMSADLDRHLKCLQDSAQSQMVFKADLRNLGKLQKSCCKPDSKFARSAEALTNAR